MRPSLSRAGRCRAEGGAGAAGLKPEPRPRSGAGGAKRDGRTGTRRLIGVGLARGEKNASGCVELERDGGELTLRRADLVRTIDDIVGWIQPEQGNWIVAVGAPLVVRNQKGRREADRQVNRRYSRYGADAYPANLDRLGGDHRGWRLWRALGRRHDGALLDGGGDAGRPRLVFETSVHPLTIEFLGFDRAIKSRKGGAARKREGQAQLAGAIRERLCAGKARPRLRIDDELEGLLREPVQPLPIDALNAREDLLAGLICAYAAAWVDARREIQALGIAGEGVTILPNARGITPA